MTLITIQRLRRIPRRIRIEHVRFFRRLLRLFFRFDAWHVRSLGQKEYARKIIDYLNGRQGIQHQSILEIGCGLGDIISNVNYLKRVGRDRDPRVLSAAAFLARIKRKGEIVFSTFDFPNHTLNGKYNIIVMVNWIHDIPPEILKEKLNDYIMNNLTDDGELLIDTVKLKGYKYKHEIGFLSEGFQYQIETVCRDVSKREVYTIKRMEQVGKNGKP